MQQMSKVIGKTISTYFTQQVKIYLSVGDQVGLQKGRSYQLLL